MTKGLILRPDAAGAGLLLALLASAPATAGDAGDATAGDPCPPVQSRPELGLMGTIPIFWGEAASPAEVIAGTAETHWARPLLERAYRLRPLDTLDASALSGLSLLLLAQPRALSPAENVALDEWVRGGGRLLLFADPLMTGESRFPLGDKRRPQDVTLLSPILDHWGLSLQFADGDGNAREAEAGGPPIPLQYPGHFAPLAEGSDCTLAAEGALARCRIGDGAGLILADAALLDLHGENAGAPRALAWLAAQAYAKAGADAGNRGTAGGEEDNTRNSYTCMLNAEGGGEGEPGG
ncbi:conserved hypothetical protein [Altererythrobacter sp. B11]|uniref:Gldg family protein n=1 Tax=Altererythrobacter sp. B11 TaxID=2060312 RepID=UPI000DC72989|nr:Gldg family protein [Altererythrobacter sp. B11]BBC74129.1 conserved hypothetical protein [Altererythrobacter sp. B11]